MEEGDRNWQDHCAIEELTFNGSLDTRLEHHGHESLGSRCVIFAAQATACPCFFSASASARRNIFRIGLSLSLR